jgi:hypothetical protein
MLIKFNADENYPDPFSPPGNKVATLLSGHCLAGIHRIKLGCPGIGERGVSAQLEPGNSIDKLSTRFCISEKTNFDAVT